MLSFLKKIFSVRFDEDSRRNVITIIGFKIRLASKALTENKFTEYKNTGGDISKTPKADGLFRVIQLSNLEILKQIDTICRDNNLDMWLAFGTLLGAVRHKGFIPWDDDIDVEMPRKDYDKLIQIINTMENSDFYTELVHKKTDVNIFLKIRHKKIPKIFIDIMPVDEHNTHLSKKERLRFSNKIKLYRKLMNLRIRYLIRQNREDDLLKYIHAKSEKLFGFSKQIPIENPDIVWGIDYQHRFHEYMVFPYSTYYPLKEIEFENYNFKCVNDEHSLLSEIYTEYMNWPSKIYAHHFPFKKGSTVRNFFGDEAFNELQKFLNKSAEELENI